jgi:Cu(I)/Ag(I) efflux system membrane fusion protein
MKTKSLYSVMLIAGLLLANFSVTQVYGQKPQNETVKQQTIMYTCSMHPEIVQDHPGNCSICGMKLVEKKDKTKGEMHHAHDSSLMKNNHMIRKHDSTMMKKDHMMHDSTRMKKGKMSNESNMMKKTK